MSKCNLCPRQCNTDRSISDGFCRSGDFMTVARAGLHYWEEPCISGVGGSGAIFFCGCGLGCSFCQNREISRNGRIGKKVTPEGLKKIYKNLISQGANNINLVTGTHFTDLIARSLDEKIPVPVIWNSSGYEKTDTLEMLKGKVDIFLPDMKYMDNALAAKLSKAPDYPETAAAAIKKMYEIAGDCEENDDGMLAKGVIVRHLILPGYIENSFRVIDWFMNNFDNTGVRLSIMGQFTPNGECTDPGRTLTAEEYSTVEDYLFAFGPEDGYIQYISSAGENYIPDFDLL